MAAASPRSSADQTSGDASEHGSAQDAPANDDLAQGDLAQRDADAPGVDPHGADANQEPSVEWGWHGTFPRATQIGGWVSAAVLFLMIIDNHDNHPDSVANWWLIGLDAMLVVLLVSDWLKRRSSWRSWRR